MVATAQRSATSYARQDKADEIVSFFLGEETFHKYVTVDTKETKYTKPNSFFKYNFCHPKFSGETFVIAFTLDSAGQFVSGTETRGLIRIAPGSDSTWITARQALDICRDQAHRIKKRCLRLVWDSTNVSYSTFEKTKDFRDIFPGTLVWQVDGEVIFGGDRYKGTFEVDVVTGGVTRRFAIPWD